MHRFGDRGREFLEILGFGEIAIDAGEADIGDIVEALERLHHHRADLLRLDFILARGFELALDSRYEAFDPRAVDRALAARSEARRVGKECVSTCRSRWAPYY